MTQGNLLIIDDNKSVLKALNILLQDEFDNVVCLANPNNLVSTLREQKSDIVLLDMNFKAGVCTGNEGIFWLNEIKKIDKDIEVVMFTAYGDVELAVKALKQGAFDFVLKPWDNDKLLATLKAAMKVRFSNLKVNELTDAQKSLKKAFGTDQQLIIGESKAMKNIIELIDKVAKTDANVLLTGENGTGKEVLAREIHKRSLRKEELFVTVDINSLPETLVESELFGYKKGAFTDAREDRTGKFQLAHNGSLFLDEIGNIPLQLQSKLLVALQTRTITPIGSNQPKPINIRLICATNSNITQMVDDSLFRSDLFYRINTIHIEIPALRERPEDIRALANHFLRKYSMKYMKPDIRFTEKAIQKLETYHWPGNIRELEHAIEKAVILSNSDDITTDNFFFKNSSSNQYSEPQTLEEMEKMMILNAMETYSGNLSLIAKQLGITRQTLYNKLKKYDI